MKSKEEAIAFLTLEANKRGKTLQEFLETDIREILDTAWKIQQREKRPVSIDELTEALNDG